MSTLESNQYSVINLKKEYDSLDKVYQFIKDYIASNDISHIIAEDQDELKESFEAYIFPTVAEDYTDLEDFEINTNSMEFDSAPTRYLLVQNPDRECYNVEIYNALAEILKLIQVGLRQENWAMVSSDHFTGGTSYYNEEGKYMDIHSIYDQLVRISS